MSSMPPLPDRVPAVEPVHDTAMAIFAIVNAAGGTVRLMDLARMCALRSDHGLLIKAAPPELSDLSAAWKRLVKSRPRPALMADVLAPLVTGGALGKRVGFDGKVEVCATERTPTLTALAAIYTFEAALLLRVERYLAP